jgi:type II secretory ATPase GspE/PulE/Tfp pilus assembly ATPase PilB-like protein
MSSLFALSPQFAALVSLDWPAGAVDLLAAPGYGQYLAWWKALLFTVIFIAWAKLLLWIDKDTLAARMPRELINSVQWGLLVAAMLVIVLVPTFVISFVIFFVLFAISVGGYLIWRNQVVGLADLPEELGTWAKNLFKSKKQKRVEHKEDVVGEGMLTVMDSRGNAPAAPEQDDEMRPAYEMTHRLLVEPLYRNAERIVFANAGERYATKYRVDGVDYPGQAIDNDVAGRTMEYIKSLAGIDSAERRKLQTGKLKVRTAVSSHELEVQSSGTRTGETLIFEIDRKNRYRDRATALGMSPQQRDTLMEVVEDNRGVVVGTAPSGGGLTALMYGLVQEHDAFVQHILTLENSIERELEGVTQALLPSDPTEEAKLVSWTADQLPDVMLITGLQSSGAAKQAIRLTDEERKRLYVGLRAGDVAEALKRWRQVVGEDKAALSRLQLVIVGRVLRKLCESCKEPYEPGESVLAKMGVPKGKVRTLYRARTEPMLDQRGNPVPCEFCQTLGYKGRLGIFEMLRVDDQVRRSLLKDSSAAAVKNLLRAQKASSLNESALRGVLAGKTDLQEVQRVMTPSSPSPKRSAQRQAS